MVSKLAQIMQDIHPDIGQLYSRMQQIAKTNHWTETDSPALAAIGAMSRGEEIAPTMQAAAVADAERYSAAQGAQLGFSEMGMESLRNALQSQMGAAKPMPVEASINNVAERYAAILKKKQ